MPLPHRVPAAVLLLALLHAFAGAAPAVQEREPARAVASRHLPLGHWAYAYVDLLVGRGRLGRLEPLVQPYRRGDIARAVRDARSDTSLAAAERAWLDLLARELEPEMRALDDPQGAGGPRASYRVSAGSRGVTHTHRDLLRAKGKATLLPFLEAELAGELPEVVGVLRFRWDEWFVNDPQFEGGIVVEEHPRFLGFLDFAGRAEEAYLELQLPYLRLFVGRAERNWGLPGTHGLLVSDYAYSYDQVAYRVGTARLSLLGLVAQLDEFPGHVKRWLSAHRVDWRIRENLSVAFGEAVTYGGENRSFDWRLSNPLNLWIVGGYGRDWEEGPNTSNNFTELAVWWRPSSGLVTYFTFAGDEFPGGGTPLVHAAAVGVQLPRLGETWGLRLDYSQVATLAYRTRRDYETYAFRGIGLGRDLSDYDLWSVRLDWWPAPRLLLSPHAHLQRRGEGDFRDPYPTTGVSESGPILFSGQMEKTLRVALAGQWRPSDRGTLAWDVGPNFTSPSATGRTTTWTCWSRAAGSTACPPSSSRTAVPTWPGRSGGRRRRVGSPPSRAGGPRRSCASSTTRPVSSGATSRRSSTPASSSPPGSRRSPTRIATRSGPGATRPSSRRSRRGSAGRRPRSPAPSAPAGTTTT